MPEEPEETTYSVGAVTRLTGLSAHVLRAWERRYGAVVPLRTQGGTRRYRASDVERLRLLRAAVEAGHPIREAARLGNRELAERASALALAGPPSSTSLGPLLDAVEGLDSEELDRLLGVQLAALGPRVFGERVAGPLLEAVGERWAEGALCVASEHLASVLVRNLLGTALRPRSRAHGAPVVLFTTPPGERHELGVLMSAVAAAEAGARCTYLGPDLPVEEIVRSAAQLEAHAVALGVCRLPRQDAESALRAIRAALPPAVELWVGGHGSRDLTLPAGAHRLDVESLEARVALLGERVRRSG